MWRTEPVRGGENKRAELLDGGCAAGDGVASHERAGPRRGAPEAAAAASAEKVRRGVAARASGGGGRREGKGAAGSRPESSAGAGGARVRRSSAASMRAGGRACSGRGEVFLLVTLVHTGLDRSVHRIYKCQGLDWWTPFLQDCLCTFYSVSVFRFLEVQT